MRLMTLLTVSAAAISSFPYSLARAQTSEQLATVEIVVPGSVIQAIEGIDIGPDGMIYGTSIHAQAVYRIDPNTGFVTVVVPSPYGESDDVAVGPKGSPVEGVLAWTAQTTGEIRIQRPGGMPEVLMSDVPRVNPIAFNKEGRLFTAQSGAGENALWELDVIGNKPPRLVAKNKGRLNGFGFGPDGRLYAPHFGTNELFAIDVDTGAFEVIAEGVGTTAATKTDVNGDVWNVDYMTGDLWVTDMQSRESRIFTNFPPPIDNLTFDKNGVIYMADLAVSGITAFDPKTRESWIVTAGSFTVPLGMALTTFDGEEAVLITDPFGYRFLDPRTGQIAREPEMWSVGGSSAAAANEEFIVTTYANFNAVRKIDRQTNTVTFLSRDIASPRGVVLTSNGDAIIADASSGKLLRLAGEKFEDVATGLNEPVALLLESDTSVLVTEIGSGTVSRVDLASGKRTELVSGLVNPLGIAALPDGRVVVVEPARGTVTAIDLFTGERSVLAHGLPISLDHHHLPASTPLGIIVDSTGAIFVSCGGDNSIVKITLAKG
jgi:sugar lactone lactonase YvrE